MLAVEITYRRGINRIILTLVCSSKNIMGKLDSAPKKPMTNHFGTFLLSLRLFDGGDINFCLGWKLPKYIHDHPIMIFEE